jgi:predicted AlkP superfamily phosphohydrolase/phosphomutase
MNRLVVIGLDCLTPQLALDAWLDDMPNLKALLRSGVGGPLRSTLPPITVPAWASMMTSKDPGTLGIYGFRNRANHGYDRMEIANATSVTERTVWDYLSARRLRSLVVGVPLTYPPQAINGVLVSGFETPSKSVSFTYPAGIQQMLDALAGGEYLIDVKDFRTEDKGALLASVRKMTEARFRAFRGLLKAGEFDFAMMVEMGPDRLQHGFWRHCDPSHRLYQPGNSYQHVLHDYYVALDAEIGRTVAAAGEGAAVMVVSDHGAKAMEGAICINEWLQANGYLSLKERPTSQTRFSTDLVDWPKTQAWGEGGYYARVFLNVAGREPQGRVPTTRRDQVCEELRAGLAALGDESGRPIGTRVFRPEEVYRQVNRIAPDLIVYFGDLNWRSAGSVGVGSLHLRENDTGPDDANHMEDGVFVWDRKAAVRQRYSIYDIAPSMLRFFGMDVPADMIGESVI